MICTSCGKQTYVIYLTDKGSICPECMDKLREEVVLLSRKHNYGYRPKCHQWCQLTRHHPNLSKKIFWERKKEQSRVVIMSLVSRFNRIRNTI